LNPDEVSDIEARVRLAYEKSQVYKLNPQNFQELDAIEEIRREKYLSKKLPLERGEPFLVKQNNFKAALKEFEKAQRIRIN
jgi:hypothetical protein